MNFQFVVADQVGSERFYVDVEGFGHSTVGCRWTKRLSEASRFGTHEEAREMIQRRELFDCGLKVLPVSTRQG